MKLGIGLIELGIGLRINSAWPVYPALFIYCKQLLEDCLVIVKNLFQSGCVSSIVKIFRDSMVWIYTIAAILAALFLTGKNNTSLTPKWMG